MCNWTFGTQDSIVACSRLFIEGQDTFFKFKMNFAKNKF